MKKLITTLLAFAILAMPAFAGTAKKATLINQVTKQKIVVTVGTWPATGWWKLYSDKLGYAVVTDYAPRLSTSMTSSQTTVPVTSVTTKDSHTLVMTDFGSVVYLTIEPGASKEEIVKCTGISGLSFTGCTRGLAFYGTSTTAVAANQKAHQSGSSVILSNVHYVYQQFMDLDTDQTIGGLKTFSTLPRSATTTPTDDTQLITLYQFSQATTTGGINASETAKGVGELSTSAEAAAGTSLGSTGARLVLPGSLASSTPSGASAVIPVTGATGLLSPTFYQSNVNTWTATNTFSGTVYGNSLNIVSLTASTTITGATTPQPVYLSTTTGALQLSSGATTATSSYYDFLGFAVTSGTNGQSVYVQTNGIVSGFSGLTVGSKYYIGTTTAGTITKNKPTASGEVVTEVGKAISATQLLLQRQKNYSPAITMVDGTTYTAYADAYIYCIDNVGASSATTNMKGYINGTLVQQNVGLTGSANNINSVSMFVPGGSTFMCDSAVALTGSYYYFN